MMRRDKLDHLVRAASTLTGHRRFVLVGSAVILVRCNNIPGDMLLTPEVDLFVPDVPEIVADPEDIALPKIVAWREKDKDWLKSALGPGSLRST